MNLALTGLEIAVVLLGITLLMIEAFVPALARRLSVYISFFGLLGVLFYSFAFDGSARALAFNGGYILDELALFAKRFFIISAIFIVLLTKEDSAKIRHGLAEFYALLMFALTGMMFSASANNLIMLFVSVELITISFYVLTGIRVDERASLEAAIKYLIIGAAASAFMAFGIALIYGATSAMAYRDLSVLLETIHGLEQSTLLRAGIAMVVVGLGFKIAMAPFQIWVPDVYQGAPTSTSAFLASGSKAAGFILLLRLLFGAVPEVSILWQKELIALSAITLLYGNLCAIPQRNLKRLLGYSSIAHAGYLLMGVTVLNQDGVSSILYYLSAYLPAVIAAFTVISIVSQSADNEDVSLFSGLNARSPFLAFVMTIALASLAGIPPLAGFFGKFLLIKSVLLQGSIYTGYYWLSAVAIIGVAISIYYYFGVIKAMYWEEPPPDAAPLKISTPTKALLVLSVALIIYLGILPADILKLTMQSATSLRFAF